MGQDTLQRLDALSTALFVTAALVLGLSVLGALAITASDDAVPGLGFEEAQRQGRAVATVLALAGGIATAGVTAALAGILKLMVAERLEGSEG